MKPYGISLVIHVTILASLHAIHMSRTQRFSSAGKSQVVSIEGSHPSSVLMDPSVPVVIPPTPVSQPIESPVDRRLPLEALDLGESLDIDDLPKIARLELSAPMPRPSQSLPVGRHAEIVRSASAAQIPEVSVTQLSRPRHQVRRISESPSVAVPPAQQISGFKESEAADLADNSPPSYPVEAIRNKWEGVVMLRLQIAKSGKVEKVEVVGSSGHLLLDQAAVKAVSRWRGKPARRWGQAIESVETLPIRFRL